MWITEKLDITAGLRNRKFHIGQCEWEAMVRNKGNRWVFPLAPTARGCAKLEEYFGEVGNCDLEVSATQADFEAIAEVAQVAVSRQDRRNGRTIATEVATRKLKDMFSDYMTKAVDISPHQWERRKKENAERHERGWEVKLERRKSLGCGSGQKIEELEDRMVISGKYRKQLKEQKREMTSQERARRERITTSRKRLQWLNQEDYIIDLKQHPSMGGSQKREGYATLPRNWELWNWDRPGRRDATRRRSNRRNRDGPSLRSRNRCEWGKWRGGEESIIKPRGRVVASSLGWNRFRLGILLIEYSETGNSENPRNRTRCYYVSLRFKRMLKCTFDYLTTMFSGVLIFRMRRIRRGFRSESVKYLRNRHCQQLNIVYLGLAFQRNCLNH